MQSIRVLTVLIAVGAVATVTAQTNTGLKVALVPTAWNLSTKELAAAEREAMQLWARYGVELSFMNDQADCQASAHLCLSVQFDARAPIRHASQPPGLGQVLFFSDGTTGSTIRVFRSNVVDVLMGRS